MPNERSQLLDMLAWRSLDAWIKDNPKPRLTARQRHRAKLWFHAEIGRLDLGELNLNEWYFQIDAAEAERMIEHAQNLPQ